MAQNVMWAGTCKYLPFAAQLEATRLAGFEALSSSAFDVLQRTADGLSIADMKRMAADAGVRLTHLDPLCTWAPEWWPGGIPEDARAVFGITVDEFLRIAEELEVESISAICTAPGGTAVETLVEPFAALCRRADGLRVDLEFIPGWGLPDLASAWRVVDGAGAANGGVTIDFWHFFRGTPDFGALDAVPAERIHSVQVCDALSHRIPGHDDLQDQLDDRLPYGWGEFDGARLLDALDRKGALEVVGPEYFSDRMEGLDPAGVARIVEETYWSALTPYGVVPSR